MKERGFVAYHSYLRTLEPLSDAEVGRLFRACLEYSETGTEPELRGNERILWPTLKHQIDRDANEYREKCEKLRQNGMNGVRARKAKGNQTQPNGNQMVSVNNQMVANENENENENETIYTNPLSLPRDVELLFSEMEVADNAAEAHDAVVAELEALGFLCERERFVGNRGDNRPGAIDIYAERNGFSMAIEIDRLSPRGKSIFKLSQVEADCKIVLLRNGRANEDYSQHYPVIVLNLKCKHEQTKRFTPPSVEEARAYCMERNNGIDPELFVDFYASKGWKVGKNPMKDWKAAVRTWEQKRKKEITSSQPKKEEPKRFKITDLSPEMRAKVELPPLW